MNSSAYILNGSFLSYSLIFFALTGVASDSKAILSLGYCKENENQSEIEIVYFAKRWTWFPMIFCCFQILHSIYKFNTIDTRITRNRERNLKRELRNANDLYIPAHNYATLKRMPLFNFPLIWNAVGAERNNPRQHLFIKHQRNALLLDLQ